MSWDKPDWYAGSSEKNNTKDWRAGGNPNAHKDWKDGGDWRWGGRWSSKRYEKNKIISYKPKDWKKPF